MSTRSTTHFTDSRYHEKPIAIIYRHSDGYPEGAGVDIKKFFAEVAKLGDTRFNDPSYLAAKYVVFLAQMFNNSYKKTDKGDWDYVKNESPLDFLSVGVCDEDPGDIEYRYIVDCGDIGKNGKPKLTCIDVSNGEEVAIP